MGNDWIDAEGFRANVGIILANDDDKLMLGGRAGAKGWQFPQGGVLEGEEPEQAMFRELHEEIGLEPDEVPPSGQVRSQAQ
jgi:putative (di)nucleoside polyphosphate hydrolase